MSGCPVPLVAAPGDLLLPDADDTCWARIRPALAGGGPWWRFDAATLRPVARRVVFATALRDAVRSTEVVAAEALASVLAMASAEDDPLLLESQLALGSELAAEWVAPSGRAGARGDVAAVARRVLASAAPGGDCRLVALRCLVATSDDRAELLGLLADGDRGVALGPDERWAATARLVVLGHDPSIIDDELARDGSSSARLAAATCRASVPVPEAKWQALAQVLEPVQPSAALAAATARGLFRPEHQHLTGPVALALLDGLDAMAGFRAGWGLSSVVKAAFPLCHSDRDVLASARRVAADPATDAAVRRELDDLADELGRRVVAVELAAAGAPRGA